MKWGRVVTVGPVGLPRPSADLRVCVTFRAVRGEGWRHNEATAERLRQALVEVGAQIPEGTPVHDLAQEAHRLLRKAMRKAWPRDNSLGASGAWRIVRLSVEVPAKLAGGTAAEFVSECSVN